MRRLVQYVILLPLSFNDGRPVPAELRLQTYEELMARFGGLTIDEVAVTGYWQHEGRRYEEPAKRVTVVGEDSAENDAFMVEFKESLGRRFGQIEIWISAQRIELL